MFILYIKKSSRLSELRGRERVRFIRYSTFVLFFTSKDFSDHQLRNREQNLRSERSQRVTRLSIVS